MIYMDINGRCGNQMFQYAFARKLMIMNNEKNLFIDFYHVERWKKKTNGDVSYSNQLINFNVVPFSALMNEGNSVLTFGSMHQKNLYRRYALVRKISRKMPKFRLLERYQNIMQKSGIFKEDECHILPRQVSAKNIFVKGYFENPTFFADIKGILIKEFTPSFEKKEKNFDLYSIIENEESVCVSFRVWHDIKDDKVEYERRNVCSLAYYTKAIDKMHELYPNAHFVIFSNDIQWVKENVSFKYPVSFETGDDEIWEKLRLMYSCKHFIMSTSTFCWWAQYLCRNPKKVVISPTVWYGDSSKDNLLAKEWIKIEV